MNTVYVVFLGEEVKGVFTSYQRAIHSVMMHAKLPIIHFCSEFGVDFYNTDTQQWAIEEHELDEI